MRAKAERGEQVCVAVVGPQGEVLGVDITPRRANGQVENGPARGRRVEKNLTELDRVVAGLAATGAGLDPLKVIDAATRLHPTPGVLYVVTSGVATVVPTDLRRLGWDLDGYDQAGRLAADGAIPGLRGWRVRFAGLGDVAGRQPKPGIALRQRLREWWLDICRAGGASDCSADPGLLPSTSPYSRNVVPVVPLPRAVVAADRVTVPNALLFAIGSHELGDGVDDVLGDVVDRALLSGELVSVEGHTDAVTGTARGNQELSEQRARAVAARLRSLGLPADLIVGVHGVGDRDADAGRENSDPGQVARDRNVQIRFETAGR